MKKIICFLLALSSLMISCNEEEEIINIQKESTLTRALSTSLEPGEVRQIAAKNINVYIKSGNKYLGIHKDGKNLCLYDNDDDSGRQKWHIKINSSVSQQDSPDYEDHYLYTYQIKTVDGYNGFDNLLCNYETYPPTIMPTPLRMCPERNNGGECNWLFDFIPNQNSYKIIDYFKLHGAYQSPHMYISRTGSNVNVDKDSNNALWEIQPIESYTLENLTWRLKPEDIITTLPDFIQEVTVVNGSSVPQTMTATYTRSATESSSFGKTTGVTVNVSTSAKVGVPIIAEGKINVSTTSANTWQYGSSESQLDQRAYSFPITVPPYTTIVSKVMVQISKLTATYTATYRGETSNTNLVLEGKWEGVQAGNIYYEIRELGSNKILKTMSSIPKNPVLLQSN